ncbi:MAG TPA: methyltransferase domain-containing protein [Thermomicrobiales bacterium]|nr:methyltransferase domain-containing protein [Thermomicrobiales bacterium]
MAGARSSRRPARQGAAPAPPPVAPHAATAPFRDLPATGPWVLRCAPGLARVALTELRFRHLVGREPGATILRQRNHDLVFVPRTLRPPGALLRVPEELHACVLYGRYKISQAQLARLAALLREQRRPFRVVVTADGAHFPRQQTQRWLHHALAGLGVPLTDDPDWDVVLWVFCVEEAYYVCLLHGTAVAAPGRAQRLAERPGALPATIAAALAFLGEPRADDTILDPVCGTGTLLAEAHAYAPEARLIGVDLDRDALAAAHDNLAGLPRLDLHHGDGARTGLSPGAVSLVLANLPFGKQFGSRESNPRLYRRLGAEIARVAARPARAVLLTADADALAAALAAQPRLKLVRRLPVRVRGTAAAIFVLRVE